MSRQLKSDGHTKYSESVKKSYIKLEQSYEVNYSEDSLLALEEIKNEFSPIFTNVQKVVCNREVKDYTGRISTEIERLISILVHSKVEFVSSQDQEY